ncbi:PQQ-dependent sugar dehydrogenase [Microbacterium sp. NPDC091662]|uniref:PQQ-dependent sugar dehydrogenase n=1 Tax=Microbacterium sp. NPDC091662 TaxID=3364211 RepID=UPI0038192C80
MTTVRLTRRGPGAPRVVPIVVTGALVAITLAACAPTSPVPTSPSPSTPSPPADSGGIAPGRASTIVEGLEAPWSIAFSGGTAFISERDTARIVEVSGDAGLRELGVIDGVAPRGEGGLLGIALRDDWLYAYSTAVGENRVQRFALSGAPGSFELGEAETVFSGLPAAGNHNGGRIAFGPDGMLYVAVGDAGDREAAQDRDSLAGKILRITPDGDVPEDNPFSGSPVYSLGHRNPQGLAWDEHGTLYASEFGQDTWDELNVIEAGGNYGWPTVEGIADRDGFVDPVQQWSPGAASPSGIAIASGSIFIANLRGERLREVPLSDLGAAHEYFVDAFGRLRDVVVAPDGALWVLTNNTDGRGDPGQGDDRIVRIPLE